MHVNTVYRYARGSNLDRPMIDGYSNYHLLTVSVDGVKALLESGINPVREVKAADGIRRPLIGIRSSPWKAGTETTPWHDLFDLDHGHVRYFGDHKVSTQGPLGSTTGNAALLGAWESHQGHSRRDRLLAPPVMIFRAVKANGAVKGYVQFCGAAVIERVERVVQSDPQTGLNFPNYVFDLAVVDTSREGDEVDWRWIDDRRDPSLGLEQTLRFAPFAWREWVATGNSILSAVRRTAVKETDSPPDDHGSPANGRFDDELFELLTRAVCRGQVIKTLGKARPNRIVSIDREGLRVETEKSVREGREPHFVPSWMVAKAWSHLVENGRLTQTELLNDLNVKRSAFVCALLAHFPGVEVDDDDKIALRLDAREAEDSELTWPAVRGSSDPNARPYTATGRRGKVNVRHFRETMTHAMDVDGLVWAFFPSGEEAQAHVERKIAEGYDAMVVPAKPYVSSERPLPRPVGQVTWSTDVTEHERLSAWPDSATYAGRLNRLFDTVRAEDGGPYTPEQVAESLQADGITVHADSIARLRAGTGSRPSDALSSALAFFFDVDPDYFIRDDEDQAVVFDSTALAEDDPTAVSDPVHWKAVISCEDLSLPQAGFVRILAGVTQAISASLQTNMDRQLVSELAFVTAQAGTLMLASPGDEIPVPRSLIDRIMKAWEETDLSHNGTVPDYRWAITLLQDRDGEPRQ